MFQNFYKYFPHVVPVLSCQRHKLTPGAYP